MWFGTGNGLNKDDGYNFTIYRHDPDDPKSLSDGRYFHYFLHVARNHQDNPLVPIPAFLAQGATLSGGSTS